MVAICRRKIDRTKFRVTYLIIFAAPSVEADLVELGIHVFSDDETDPPITLIVFGVDEVTFIVVLSNGVFLAFAHRYINYQRIIMPY
jgi:hypothetical protein